MLDQLDSLRERYSALSDDELHNIAVTGGLTAQARELLGQELRRRGIEGLSGYKEHLQRVDQECQRKKQQALERKEKSIRLYSRIGYSVSLAGIVAGLIMLYVHKDERNGVGTIIASAIMLPVVWMIALVRRHVWRFLLRP